MYGGKMNNKLIIFSRCKKIKGRTFFHFKGVYLGIKISNIEVCGDYPYLNDVDYLIWGEVVKFEKSTLFIKTCAAKAIN